MKWHGRRKSGDLEDRRGMSGGGKAAVGGGIIGIIILLVNAFGGENAQMIAPILEQLNSQQSQTRSRDLTEKEMEEAAFIDALLVDNKDIWAKILAENNLPFESANTVLFNDGVTTACGSASSASGPFYCPSDRKIYMDLVFFEELKSKFGAQGGDFAVAYVVAHEYGHHIQTLLGTSQQVREQQSNLSDRESNKLSVALELQADFYAGLWTHYNQKCKTFSNQAI